MDQNTFQMALISTARVACCATLLGLSACRDGAVDKQDIETNPDVSEDTGEIEQDDTANTDTEETEDTSVSDSGEEDTAEDTSVLEDTAVDPDEEDTAEESDVLFEDEALQECAEHIDDTFSSNVQTTTETVDCCVEVTEAIGYVDLFEYEFQTECCDLIAQNNAFSSACTPWGPPVPPSMV